MLPRGSSCCVSWIRTFWKSTNRDALTSNMNRRRLLQLGFLQIVGWGGEEISGVKWEGRREGGIEGVGPNKERRRKKGDWKKGDGRME